MIKIRVITSEVETDTEILACNAMFQAGLTELSLRRPNIDIDKCKKFIEGIEPKFRNRIILHQHYELVEKYGLKGIHVKSGTVITDEMRMKYKYIGISCHSLQEVKQINNADYCFISPLFDSISKIGYKSNVDLKDVEDFIKTNNAVEIYALGGISDSNIDLCLKVGINNIAILGAIWQNNDPIASFKNIAKLIPHFKLSGIKLMYITDVKDGVDIDYQIDTVCRGGVKLVQLRMKDASYTERLSQAKKALKICQKYGSLLIIDDDVEVTKQVNADGVHLGKSDMEPIKARQELGYDKIIGFTCNSWDDIIAANNYEVDYIGVGPYKYTTTKKKLSQILGLQAYIDYVTAMKNQGINLPIFAIGGIETCDIQELMSSNINGIAVSGLIKNAEDMYAKAKEICIKVKQK